MGQQDETIGARRNLFRQSVELRIAHAACEMIAEMAQEHSARGSPRQQRIVAILCPAIGGNAHFLIIQKVVRYGAERQGAPCRLRDAAPCTQISADMVNGSRRQARGSAFSFVFRDGLPRGIETRQLLGRDSDVR